MSSPGFSLNSELIGSSGYGPLSRPRPGYVISPEPPLVGPAGIIVHVAQLHCATEQIITCKKFKFLLWKEAKLSK